MKSILLIVVVLLLLGVGGYWATPPQKLYGFAMGVEQRVAGLERKTITVDKLSYVYHEDGDGPPLLLLHGFSADRHNWNRLAGELQGRFQLIAPDLVGFGDSSAPMDVPYDIDSQARRLWAFVDALGLEEIDLAGSSMGGYIAAVMTEQRPDSVKSLWLLAPGGIVAPPYSEMFDMILEQGKNPLIVREPEDFDFTWDFIFSEPPYLPGRIRQGFAERQQNRAKIYEPIFDAIRYDSRPLEETAVKLAAPTLIVWGDEDRVLHPAGGVLLTELMSEAKLIRMPGIGHLPMIEAPAKTASDYLAWRQTLGR